SQKVNKTIAETRNSGRKNAYIAIPGFILPEWANALLPRQCFSTPSYLSVTVVPGAQPGARLNQTPAVLHRVKLCPGSSACGALFSCSLCTPLFVAVRAVDFSPVFPAVLLLPFRHIACRDPHNRDQAHREPQP